MTDSETIATLRAQLAERDAGMEELSVRLASAQRQLHKAKATIETLTADIQLCDQEALIDVQAARATLLDQVRGCIATASHGYSEGRGEPPVVTAYRLDLLERIAALRAQPTEGHENS